MRSSETDDPDASTRAPSRGAPRLLLRFLSLWLLVMLGGALASFGAGGVSAQAASPASPGATRALLALFAALLAVSAAAAAAEIAIFSLNRLDIVKIRQSRSRRRQALIYLLDNPSDTLATLMILNNVMHVAISLTTGALAEIQFAGQSAESFAVAAFGATAFILVFGEAIPKGVAHAKATTLAPLVAWPVAMLAILFTPFRFVINHLIRAVFRMLGVEEPKATDWVSEEELKAVMSAGEVSNVLEEDEREMIEGVFELRHSFAEEIMIPRPDVEGYPDTLAQEEMLAKLRATPHSRVLVYHDSLDQPIGFLLVKEALLDPAKPWRERVRDLPLLPLRIRLIDLLKRFRKDRAKMAALVDEYGGVAGIVTQHDVMEEIVGDIAERHEAHSEEFAQVGEGRWRVSGQMNLQDLAKELEREFPEDMGTTVGGFVMNALGRVPSVGSELLHEGLVFKVTRMVGRRVMQIEIAREQPAPEPERQEAAT